MGLNVNNQSISFKEVSHAQPHSQSIVILLKSYVFSMVSDYLAQQKCLGGGGVVKVFWRGVLYVHLLINMTTKVALLTSQEPLSNEHQPINSVILYT